MKTTENLNAVLAGSLDDYRAMVTAIRGNLKTLESLYNASIDGKPSDTIKAYVEVVGYDSAVELIASLVNVCAGDGRISSHVNAWATAQDNAYDKAAAEQLWLRTGIHCAHLNQLAGAMMRYKPEKSVEENEQQEEPEEEVTVWVASDCSHGREYIVAVDGRSPREIAEDIGRCEFGEIIQIWRKGNDSLHPDWAFGWDSCARRYVASR